MIAPLAALLLAAAPADAGVPESRSHPAERSSAPAETALSVGVGQVRSGASLGAGLTLSRNAAEMPAAPGKNRLVYHLEVHTGASGFPRWIEAKLSFTEGARASGAAVVPEHADGPFVAAVAVVLRWLSPRDPHVVTFAGTSTGAVDPARPEQHTQAAWLSLGWGVEF